MIDVEIRGMTAIDDPATPTREETLPHRHKCQECGQTLPDEWLRRGDEIEAALHPASVPPRPDDALRDYIDQLEAPTPLGYSDTPRETFEAGFGWAIDAVLDFLDGRPWKGGVPSPTHDKDGKPLATPAAAVREAGLRERIEAWLDEKRRTRWTGPKSMTAEDGYNAAIEEVESLL